MPENETPEENEKMTPEVHSVYMLFKKLLLNGFEAAEARGNIQQDIMEAAIVFFVEGMSVTICGADLTDQRKAMEEDLSDLIEKHCLIMHKAQQKNQPKESE